MRSTLSPTFTSSKMKQMFGLITSSAQQFTEYFRNQKDDDMITVEMKDTFTRFTNDVIATTAFGVSCDSLTNRNNQFYLMGRELTNIFGILTTLKFIAFAAIPQVATVCIVPINMRKLFENFDLNMSVVLMTRFFYYLI